MRMLKVSFGRLKPTCDTRVIHFDYTLEKCSLRNEKLIVVTSLQSFDSGLALFLMVFCFVIFASYPQPFFYLFFSL